MTADFRVPGEPSRICYFAIPADLIGWYRENLFPEVEASGMVPVTARDVFSPPGAVPTKIDTLVFRASLVVTEIRDPSSEYEANLALARKSPERVLLVEEGSTALLTQHSSGAALLRRPSRFETDPEPFIESFRDWIGRAAMSTMHGTAEPTRLLALNEPSAALISAVSLLEVLLAERLGGRTREASRNIPLRSMLRAASSLGLFESEEERSIVEKAVFRRNEVIHTRAPFSSAEGRRLVEPVLRFIDRLSPRDGSH